MLSAIKTSVGGLLAAGASARQASDRVVQATLPVSSPGDQARAPDLARSIVDLKLSAHAYKANAVAVRTANETLGTLLDETS